MHVFLEIGPKADLTPLIKRYVRTKNLSCVPEVTASLHQGRCDVTCTPETMASLYQHGVTPDWAVVTPGPATTGSIAPYRSRQPATGSTILKRQGIAEKPQTVQVKIPHLEHAPSRAANHSELITRLSKRVAHLDLSENASDISSLTEIICAVFGHALRYSSEHVRRNVTCSLWGWIPCWPWNLYKSLIAFLVFRVRFGFYSDHGHLMLFITPCQALMTAEKVEQTHTTLVPDVGHRYHPFPLTELQHAYWVGRGSACHLGILRVMCTLKTDTLCHERHFRTPGTHLLGGSALRLVIDDDGQQRILSEVPWYALSTHDASKASVHALEQHLEAWQQDLSHQILSTNTWPLFDLRVCLLPNQALRIHEH